MAKLELIEPARTSLGQDCIFDVSVNGQKVPARRRIRISSQASLYKLAQAIVDAFGFDFDHCFGFYDTLDSRRKAKIAFEYFVDIGEGASVPGAKSVKRSKVSDAFQSVGQKLIFLFDYGDDWQFFVRLVETRESSGSKKPLVLERTGENPEQYPPCEDL